MTYKNKTITKHARGNWFVRIRYNGKYISIYGRTKVDVYEKLKVIADKAEQEKFLKLLGSLTTPQFVQKEIVPTASPAPTVKTYTLQEWFQEWLNSYKTGCVRASTINGFKVRFKRLKDFYDIKLTDITNLMLSKALNEITSCSARDAAHNLIKQMFSVAFTNHLIETNPAASLPRPKQVTVFEKKAFTQEQENKFIELCLADLDTYEPLLITLLQGLRKGEMLALRPNDFNFEKNIMRVDESYDEYHPDDLQTKNAASNRKMPMFGLTKKILAKYADACPTERIYRRFNTTVLYRSLERLLKENGLPRLTVHELRHTFISRCHEKGVEEMIVQKWVGHQIGSRMTKAVYTHISNDAEQEFIKLLNAKTA